MNIEKMSLMSLMTHDTINAAILFLCNIFVTIPEDTNFETIKVFFIFRVIGFALKLLTIRYDWYSFSILLLFVFVLFSSGNVRDNVQKNYVQVQNRNEKKKCERNHIRQIRRVGYTWILPYIFRKNPGNTLQWRNRKRKKHFSQFEDIIAMFS